MPSSSKALFKGTFISKGLTVQENKPIIAVTMATSRQGRAVVNHLSKTGEFKIRAITRSLSSKEAIKLSKLPNVETVEGDLLIPSSLDKCFNKVYGIFGNTTPTKGWSIGRGSIDEKYELIQGKNLINAVNKAKQLGTLKHFIFSSICKAKNPLINIQPPGHFSSKWRIEEFIKINNLKDISTIIRPVSYFENFNSDLPGVKISSNNFPGIVNKDIVWQTIAVDDIGGWTKAIFKNPKRFITEELNIAGEELTGQEMAKVWQKTNKYSSKKIKYTMVPRIVMKLVEYDIAQMATWIEKTGYGADLKLLKNLAKELDIQITPLSKWLKSNSLINTPPPSNSKVKLLMQLRAAN